jgi:phosphoadenosine phosphosulfate reductase
MSEPSPLLAPLAPEREPPRLWKNGGFVADPWVMADDEAPLPLSSPAIVTLSRWRRETAGDPRRAATLGVILAATEEVDVRACLAAPLVAIRFAKFTDGRGYSIARQLRGAGFSGEIRAIGDVLADQAPLMLRAGFNALLVIDSGAIATLGARGVPAVRRIYQPGLAECGTASYSRAGEVSV